MYRNNSSEGLEYADRGRTNNLMKSRELFRVNTRDGKNWQCEVGHILIM